MSDIKIYHFKDTLQYALESIIPGHENYKKYYLMSLEPGNERVTFISPYSFTNLGEFNPDTTYREIPKDSDEYRKLIDCARSLSIQLVDGYNKKMDNKWKAGNFTDIERNSSVSTVKSFYSDLITA